ncbi:MAG: RtcB family protein, partial [Polyangiaceae bacterium]
MRTRNWLVRYAPWLRLGPERIRESCWHASCVRASSDSEFPMDMLPSNASLIAHPSVWMESEAVSQLARVASHPDCLRAAGMPDLHPGRGIPIGAAFAFEGTVLPDLVGGDAGCGVLLVVGHKDG